MEIAYTVLTAIITSGVVTAILNWYIKSKELGDQRRWEIKREACLEALEIIDSRFADYDWKSNGDSIKIDEQGYVTTEKIRSCFNRLILACEDSKVPLQFEKCLNLKVDDMEHVPVTMDSVVDLRNAIRTELGFGKDLRTNVSWITNINWRDAKKNYAHK